MWSSETSSYQKEIREAFQGLMLKNEVDMYWSGHIHWYERLWPLTEDGKVDHDSVIDKDNYQTNPGVSMTHVINGQAGNVESHSSINASQILPITNVLDQKHYGFSKVTVHSKTKLSYQFIRGFDGSVGDELTLVKKSS